MKIINAFMKARRVIFSCKTYSQLMGATQYVVLFSKLLSPTESHVKMKDELFILLRSQLKSINGNS